MSSAEIRSRSAAGVGLLVGRGVAFRALGFLGSLVLARLLVPADFGVIAVGLTLVTFGEFLANAGLGAALIARPDPPDRGELRAITGFQLLVTAIFAAVSALVIAALSNYGTVTAFVLLSLPLMAYRSPAMLLLERHLEWPARVKVEITEVVLNLVISIGLASLGFGAWSLAIATVARAAAGTAMACVLSPAGFLVPSLQFARLRSLFGFGVKFLANGVVQRVQDLVLVGGIAAIGGVGMLGLWTFAWRILQLPWLLLDSLHLAAFPAFSRLAASGEDLKDLLERTVTTTAVGIGVIVGPLVGSSPALIPLAFGDVWTDVSLILPGSAFALVVFGPIAITVSGFLYATGDATTPLWGAVVHGVVRLASTMALLPAIGVAAIGVGWAAGSVAGMPIMVRRVNRLNGARPGWCVLRPTLASSVGAAAGWIVAEGLGVTVASALLSTITALAVFVLLMASLGRDDLRNATGMLQRIWRETRFKVRPAEA